MIESAAEKAGLRLGSRAVDSFRGVVRLSFEKEVQTGAWAAVMHNQKRAQSRALVECSQVTNEN
jgi:hypothetical protein